MRILFYIRALSTLNVRNSVLYLLKLRTVPLILRFKYKLHVPLFRNLNTFLNVSFNRFKICTKSFMFRLYNLKALCVCSLMIQVSKVRAFVARYHTWQKEVSVSTQTCGCRDNFDAIFVILLGFTG